MRGASGSASRRARDVIAATGSHRIGELRARERPLRDVEADRLRRDAGGGGEGSSGWTSRRARARQRCGRVGRRCDLAESSTKNRWMST
jgi:hypothetical protein